MSVSGFPQRTALLAVRFIRFSNDNIYPHLKIWADDVGLIDFNSKYQHRQSPVMSFLSKLRDVAIVFMKMRILWVDFSVAVNVTANSLMIK